MWCDMWWIHLVQDYIQKPGRSNTTSPLAAARNRSLSASFHAGLKVMLNRQQFAHKKNHLSRHFFIVFLVWTSKRESSYSLRLSLFISIWIFVNPICTLTQCSAEFLQAGENQHFLLHCFAPENQVSLFFNQVNAVQLD